MNKEQIAEKIKAFFTRLGKRNLIIICSVMLVAIAVGVNCIIAATANKDPASAGAGADDTSTEDAGASSPSDADSYFAASALSRQKARDEALAVLQSVVDDDTAGEEARAGALADIAQMAKDMENEANVESLVMSKGFERCIAVISSNGISVVVDVDGTTLNAAQIAQINTIVYEQTGITPDKTVIIEK